MSTLHDVPKLVETLHATHELERAYLVRELGATGLAGAIEFDEFESLILPGMSEEDYQQHWSNLMDYFDSPMDLVRSKEDHDGSSKPFNNLPAGLGLSEAKNSVQQEFQKLLIARTGVVEGYKLSMMLDDRSLELGKTIYEKDGGNSYDSASESTMLLAEIGHDGVVSIKKNFVETPPLNTLSQDIKSTPLPITEEDIKIMTEAVEKLAAANQEIKKEYAL